MGAYIPKFMPGAAVTYTAGADITGGQLVAVTGDRVVGVAGLDSAAVAGVASRDAKNGEQVTVFSLRGAVHRVVAAGEVDAGESVTAAASGRVAALVASGEGATKNVVGLALTSAAAAGDVIEVQG